MTEANKNINDYVQGLIKMLEKMKSGVPEGYHYKSQYDFINQHGKFYESKELDSTEKQIIKKTLKRINFTPQKKQCFYNAQKMALADNTGKIKYCEGFALNIIPTNHAWIEINGKVVDVTWDNEGEMILGTFPDDIGYYGFTIDNKTVREKNMKDGPGFSFLDDYNHKFELLKLPFK